MLDSENEELEMSFNEKTSFTAFNYFSGSLLFSAIKLLGYFRFKCLMLLHQFFNYL